MLKGLKEFVTGVTHGLCLGLNCNLKLLLLAEAPHAQLFTHGGVLASLAGPGWGPSSPNPACPGPGAPDPTIPLPVCLIPQPPAGTRGRGDAGPLPLAHRRGHRPPSLAGLLFITFAAGPSVPTSFGSCIVRIGFCCDPLCAVPAGDTPTLFCSLECFASALCCLLFFSTFLAAVTISSPN